MPLTTNEDVVVERIEAYRSQLDAKLAGNRKLSGWIPRKVGKYSRS